jgi:hypothetical protein
VEAGQQDQVTSLSGGQLFLGVAELSRKKTVELVSEPPFSSLFFCIAFRRHGNYYSLTVCDQDRRWTSRGAVWTPTFKAAQFERGRLQKRSTTKPFKWKAKARNGIRILLEN